MPIDLPQPQSPGLAAQRNIQTHRRTHSSTTPEPPRTNSPLKKVWEEYHNADEVSEETNQNRIEESADITFSSDEVSRNSRTHQRSLTELFPFRSTTRRASHTPEPTQDISPTKEYQEFEYMASFTGDRNGQTKIGEKAKGGLSSWFTGSPAATKAGGPGTEQNDTVSKTSIREPSPNRRLERKGTFPTVDLTTPAKASTGSSVFGFFSPKSPARAAQSVQLPADLNTDEFLTMDIHSSLFPSGQADPFSPAAFKNLLTNAEGLLLKLQTAYKLRTIEFYEMRSEKDAQSEELEEAETRNKHLKLQLEDMVKKLNEQDGAIEDMVTQLAVEKQTRLEERERILAKIQQAEEAARTTHRASCCSNSGEEDLGINTKTKWRTSGSSADMSGESDDDAASGGGESVFSRSRSPTLTVSTVMTRDSTRDRESIPDMPQATFSRVGALQKDANIISTKPKVPASTFQKILKSTGMGSSEPSPVGGMGLESGCANCRGQGASMAWDTVGLLRVENKGLKDRVGELEVAVEGALDLCAGLGVPGV